jgi:hypothetical protein
MSWLVGDHAQGMAEPSAEAPGTKVGPNSGDGTRFQASSAQTVPDWYALIAVGFSGMT